MLLLPICFLSLLGLFSAEVMENKQSHRVNSGVEKKKLKSSTTKEGNPVGKRGGDALHFGCRTKQWKKSNGRVSMWKKHLNRIKPFRKAKREKTWETLKEQYKGVKMGSTFS